MTWDELLAYCLAKPSAWQDEPWDGDVVVKVGNKIFAFLGSGSAVGVKCGRSRDVADEWLHRYPDDASVMAYIGRSGWNSIQMPNSAMMPLKIFRNVIVQPCCCLDWVCQPRGMLKAHVSA